jgi:hypothetical protein
MLPASGEETVREGDHFRFDPFSVEGPPYAPAPTRNSECRINVRS